jgi:hypothetical protein
VFAPSVHVTGYGGEFGWGVLLPCLLVFSAPLVIGCLLRKSEWGYEMTIAGKKRPAAAAGDGGDEFVSLLAEAGCNLLSQGPTVVTRDLQQRLQLTLKGADASIVANFVAGLESHVQDDGNLHRYDDPLRFGRGTVSCLRFRTTTVVGIVQYL